MKDYYNNIKIASYHVIKVPAPQPYSSIGTVSLISIIVKHFVKLKWYTKVK